MTIARMLCRWTGRHTYHDVWQTGCPRCGARFTIDALGGVDEIR